MGWAGGGPYLGHDGGGEGAAVIDPAVPAWLRGSLAPVGGCGVGLQELPLRLAEAATLVRLVVGAQWDGDDQEGLGCEVCQGLRAIVQHVGPAAVARRGG